MLLLLLVYVEDNIIMSTMQIKRLKMLLGDGEGLELTRDYYFSNPVCVEHDIYFCPEDTNVFFLIFQ